MHFNNQQAAGRRRMARMAMPRLQAKRNFVYRAMPLLFAPLDAPETIRVDVALSRESVCAV